ncbi:hypothetical protein PAE4_10147 [Bacillus altitudinis]|uniref:Uncharacterized protein n=1 Tax=Bacillus altitudinis TaxID=293387 RepID=A0A653Y0L3_BACAB|nr:hypothetical protein PAE4_10147 [Bacillus altitudinis]VXC23273.1 hypothetical protein BACI9J_60978 [Bacillus altitudinis]VXC35953.1 hypothetical protein BACI348_50988 [Bacillus altitudinis]
MNVEKNIPIMGFIRYTGTTTLYFKSMIGRDTDEGKPGGNWFGYWNNKYKGGSIWTTGESHIKAFCSL